MALAKKQLITVKEKETMAELTVPHNGRKLTFLHLAYGPNTYANVAQAIEQEGLHQPTMAEITSLVYAALNSGDRYSQEIRDKMRDNWIWGFVGELDVLREGVYIEDRPAIRNGFIFMDKNDLEERLKKGDPRVRFIRPGFKTESMTPMEIADNSYLVALVGAEGTEKIAQIADKQKRNKTSLWNFKSENQTTARVLAFSSNWLMNIPKSYVFGYDVSGGRQGLAYAIKRPGENNHAKQ